MAGDRGLVRYGFEREEGVPGVDYRFTRFVSESLRAEPIYRPDPNLDPSGNETQGEILEVTGAGSLVNAANSESLLEARYHHHGYGEVTNPAAGVYLHELRDRDEDAEDPLDFYVDSLHFGIWRDELRNPTEYHALGFKATEFTVRTDAHDYVFFEHAGLFLRDRYMRKPEEQGVVAYAGDVEVRGHRTAGDENGTYHKFKVITSGALDGSLPLPTIQWGKGVAAYPGLGIATYPVVPNEWMDAHNPDGTIVGPQRMPMQIRLVADPLVDELTAGEEYFIYATAPKPVATFSARPNLNAAACDIRFSTNGGTTWTTRRIEGGYSLKMGRPREAKPGLGSVYKQTIGRPQEARKWWELTFNGTYEDLGIPQAMLGGTIFSAESIFYGAYIGATGLRDFARYTLENMRATAGGATIANAGDMPETVTLRAFSSGGSYLCKEEYQNTIASVAPA